MQLKYLNEIYTCTFKINNMSTAFCKQSDTAPVQLQNHLEMFNYKVTGTDYYDDEIAFE